MAILIVARRPPLLWQLLTTSLFRTLSIHCKFATSQERCYCNKAVSTECGQFLQAPRNWQFAMKCDQMRKFSASTDQQQSGTHMECWNCKKPTDRYSHMICSSCGHLQPVDTKINYFELLNIPHSFALEPRLLTQRFRQLQVLVHPDKFSNKTLREQIHSADWSSLINKAYKTLSAPIERGQYILQLLGLQLTQDNSGLDKEFLMAMMERNEKVEMAASRHELAQMSAQITLEMEEKGNTLQAQFTRNALEEAKATLVEMKYLLSIQNSIKRKQEELLGSLH